MFLLPRHALFSSFVRGLGWRSALFSTAILVGLLPKMASAADGRIQLASANGAVRSFISLDQARNPAAAARVVNPAASARSGLSNDRDGMRQGGFMRLDRDMLVVNVRRPSALTPVTRPTAALPEAASASNVATKSNDPVLDLFGGADDLGAGPVFGRTMRSAPVRGHAWPVPSNAKQYVSSGFGMRKDPFTGRPKFHGGIDIAAATGTPVLATADGVITGVGRSGGMGNSITIRNRDGSESMYGHLSAQQVRPGQQVRQGQQIGRVGSTGRSTGSHLDYRIKMNGQRLNPMQVLVNLPSSVRLAQAQIRR
jgi:murein DD-endopeptidase MepM/ murein hydrolase activator NlpD